MKVPHSYVGRTQTPSQTLGYLEGRATPEAFGAGIARGLAAVGGAVEVRMASLKQREEKADRFQSLTNFSDFTNSMQDELTELKRNSAPDGKGFTEAASALIEKRQQEFLAKSVTPELRDEFSYRSTEMKNSLLHDAMNFQYTQGDAYFREGINKEYQKMLKSVDPETGGSAEQMKAAKAHMTETIIASDLAESDKAALIQTMSIGLESVAYKQAVKESKSLGLKGDHYDIIRREEGFRATPYWDVNHLRLGYGSDTVTFPDGSYRNVRKGDVVTREDAERDLARRHKEFTSTASGQVGDAAWDRLSGSAKAALVSVTYNYGSLPGSVVAAVRGGDTNAIAQSVANLSANPNRRQKEAAMIRGGGDPSGMMPDDDPAYSNVPYETRVAIHGDVDQELKRAQAEQEQAAKDVYNTQYNTLLNGANDGTAGYQDIDQAREDGWLTDASDIMRAQEIVKKRGEDSELAARVTNALGTPFSIWDPTDEDSKKAFNQWVKPGLTNLANMDASWVQNTLNPAVAQLHDIPTDVIGQLTGMMRSKSDAQMLFAHETLRQLEEMDGDAYRDRVPDELEKQVEIFRRYKDNVPFDQLLERMHVTDTPEGRRVDADLRKEAQTILATQTGGTEALTAMVGGALEGFAGLRSVHLTAVPAYQKDFQYDYQLHFEDGYAMFGNKEEADVYANKTLQKQWGVTDIGGSRLVMKRPPEKAGYKPLNGSFDWMSRQVRQERKLKDDQTFELISDDQTEQEYRQYQQDPNAELPSYKVVVVDADGTYRADNTSPRYAGKPQEFDLIEDQNAFIRKDLGATMIQKENELNRAKLEFRNRGQELPPEFQEEYDAAKKAYDEYKPQEMQGVTAFPRTSPWLMNGKR